MRKCRFRELSSEISQRGGSMFLTPLSPLPPRQLRLCCIFFASLPRRRSEGVLKTMPCSEAHTCPWPNKGAPPFGSKTRLNNQDQEVDIVRELICGNLCIKTSRILSTESNRQHIVSSIVTLIGISIFLCCSQKVIIFVLFLGDR